MNKYILIGIPYCGKSTLGQRVAELLQIPFFDTDVMAKEKMGERRLFEAFSSYSHMQFHEAQKEVVRDLLDFQGSAMIATGAEVALIPESLALLKDLGWILHIQRDAPTILEELKNNMTSPVLIEKDTGTVIDFRQKSVEAYLEDLPHYEAAADLRMDNNGSEDEGVERLMTLIQGINIKERQTKRGKFDSEFCHVQYMEGSNLVLLTWKKFCRHDDYKEPTLFALELLKRHKNTDLVIDARNGFEDEKEDVEWAFSTLLPDMSKTDCKNVVLIMKETHDIEDEMDMWAKEFKKYFTVHRVASCHNVISLVEPKQVN